MNHYEELGVARTASKAEIRHAYRRLAGRYHPDRKGGDVKKFQIIQRAYDTLGDDARRAHYDQYGAEPGEPTIRARALQTLATIFAQAIANEQLDVDRVNLVEKVREGIINGQKSVPDRVKQLGKTIARFERAAKRLKKKKGEANIIGQMLAVNIAGLKRGLRQLEEEKEVGDEMLKVLEEYEYLVDFSQWAAASPTAASSILGALGGLGQRR